MPEPLIQPRKQTAESGDPSQGKDAAEGVALSSDTAEGPRGNRSWVVWFFSPWNKRFLKARISIMIVAALLVARGVYVRIVYSGIVRDLRKAGYVKHLIETGASCEKWVHPSDPEKMYVRLYWYPRPPSSSFQRIDDAILRSARGNWNQWTGQVCLFLHFAFMEITVPFLVPIDSRTGFDPNSLASIEQAFSEPLTNMAPARENRDSR